jgi:NADP-reducing hydrogenase subunit HndA
MLPSENYRQPSAGAVLAALHGLSERLGYLPEEVLREAATDLTIPLSQLFGAVTFYSSFSQTPPGLYKVQVCEGTACYVRGAAELLERLVDELGIQPDETTEDLIFTLKSVRCVGSCGLAPVLRVDEKTYGRLEPADLLDIMEQHRTSDQIEVES